MQLRFLIAPLLMLMACQPHGKHDAKQYSDQKTQDTTIRTLIPKAHLIASSKENISVAESKDEFNTGISDADIYAFINDYFSQTDEKIMYLDENPGKKNIDSNYIKNLLFKPSQQNEHNGRPMTSEYNPVPKIFSNNSIKFMLGQLKRYKNFRWNDSYFNSIFPQVHFDNSGENYYLLSIPIFSPDKKYVLLTAEYHCKGLCGGGGTRLFTKQKGHWVPKGNKVPSDWVY